MLVCELSAESLMCNVQCCIFFGAPLFSLGLVSVLHLLDMPLWIEQVRCIG